MLSVTYVECRYAECHYTDCLYAECRGAKIQSFPNGLNPRRFQNNLTIILLLKGAPEPYSQHFIFFITIDI
jgi:hypothetical protein